MILKLLVTIKSKKLVVFRRLKRLVRKYHALALSTRYSLFSTGSCRYVSSSKSSLFSLSSINGYPSVKVIIKSSHYSNAIQYTRSSLGPSFGNGHNLHVYDNNAAGNRSSYTYCVPPNPSPLGSLHLVLSVDFMQDPANSHPLMWETHLQFCKRYLEVNNKASNIACRAELGRFPLNITINKKILKYICTFSLKMRNLSSKNLFKSHLTYTIIAKIACTLI